MSELQPIIPAQDDGLQIAQDPPDTPEPAPITEQEVGEYREQDRFLPVRTTTLIPLANTQPNHYHYPR
jgi:hypothetical protein